MKDFITLVSSKISEYELHVNLFVGALWVMITGILFEPKILQLPIGFIGVLAYFAGLICGRIGSHMIEPFLIRCTPYRPPKEFYAAEKKDEKIVALMKTKTMYRNLAALMLIVLGMRLWLYTDVAMCVDDKQFYLITVSLFLLFIMSYVKQAEYVDARVVAAVKRLDAEKESASKA